jgi:hypothetical protein
VNQPLTFSACLFALWLFIHALQDPRALPTYPLHLTSQSTSHFLPACLPVLIHAVQDLRALPAYSLTMNSQLALEQAVTYPTRLLFCCAVQDPRALPAYSVTMDSQLGVHDYQGPDQYADNVKATARVG